MIRVRVCFFTAFEVILQSNRQKVTDINWTIFSKQMARLLVGLRMFCGTIYCFTTSTLNDFPSMGVI
jgi:uncharacterized membrane protein YgdD (TMEM256/DUF423 family)